MSKKERCETCRYWSRHIVSVGGKPAAPGRRGDCRRYPPVVIQVGNEDCQYPLTPQSEWCGEWQSSAADA